MQDRARWMRINRADLSMRAAMAVARGGDGAADQPPPADPPQQQRPKVGMGGKGG